jgi:hypothetical protein
METTISDEIQAGQGLKQLIERADIELRRSFRTRAEGRTWRWTLAPSLVPAATLTVEYEGNSSSRTFSLVELQQPKDLALDAHDLWQDVLLANVRRSRDTILSLLREIEVEQPQGA